MSSTTVQDQVWKYAQSVLLQLYSLITAITFHLTGLTANLINEYPQISISLISVTALIISIYLIKNLIVFFIRSLIKLVKLLSVVSIVVLGLVVYFRGLEFFTVDLVNLYNAIVKDVGETTIYSDKIYDNIEAIYRETINHGELLEQNNKYLKFVASKTDYYKHFLNFFN